MHSTLFIALTAGLGGMLAWGTADFFAKRTIDEIGDLRTLFWQQLIGCVPLLAAFLLHPKLPTLHHYDPLFLLLFGVVSGLAYLAFYSGLGKGQVSLLSPIMASYSVVVVILSIIILGESLTAGRAVAIVVTVFGILLISTDPKDLSKSLRKGLTLAGLPDVLVAVLSYSFWLLFLDKFLDGKQWLFYLLVIRAIASLTLAVYAKIRRIALGFKQRELWKYLVLIGLFDVGAFSFVSYGFSHSQYPSVIAVLSSTFSLPTMLLAYVFLKERIQRYQLVATFAIIAGIVLISLT